MSVGVSVAVGVDVAVGVAVGVAVSAAVGVGVGVAVGEGVPVPVGVDVGDGPVTRMSSVITVPACPPVSFPSCTLAVSCVPRLAANVSYTLRPLSHTWTVLAPSLTTTLRTSNRFQVLRAMTCPVE